METRSILVTATLALATLTMIQEGFGQEVQIGAKREGATDSDGIRTDRLTSRQLQTWRSIERIVQAVDGSGRPLHPKLFGLWQRIQSKGHTVFIEMTEHQAPTAVGAKTTLEKTGLDGNRRAAVIWMQLWAMDKALANRAVQRPDGLIPYNRLGKHERYAEALGHELAHAVLMLEDPGYEHLCSEYRLESAELLALLGRGHGAANPEIMPRRQRLQSMADRIEKPAEAAEIEIWRELLNGQKHQSRAAAR